jgi:hypothetical protein
MVNIFTSLVATGFAFFCEGAAVAAVAASHSVSSEAIHPFSSFTRI